MIVVSADGHRKRLRSKLLASGLTGFHDYEVIELLLTLGIPRKDCKPIAKELLKKYGSVTKVINADVRELASIRGLGEASIFGIRLVRELGIYCDKELLSSRNHKTIDLDHVAKHLIRAIGYDKKETFKVICLNTKGSIIIETASIGSLNSSIAHPREVFKLAIENSAASIVIAHNHPSGDTSPSEDDIFVTRKIVEAGKIIGIDVVDHLIVSNEKYSSLDKLGYL